MKHVSVVLMAVLLCAAPVVMAQTTDLFPVEKEGKWGFMNRQGKLTIPPRFDAAWDFSEGLAAVQEGLLRGYIDAQGKMVIKPAFARVRPFKEGLAAVLVDAKPWGAVMDGGRWVYIDKSGGIVLDPKGKPLLSADDFQAGMARVSFIFNNHERFSLMDVKGHVLPFVNLPSGRFSDGLAAFASGAKGPYGYIGAGGHKLIESRFKAAGDFVDGLAPVSADGKLWHYIDKSGAKAIAADYQEARSFSDGLASVKIAGKWGAIDRAGKLAVAPQFDFVAPCSEGLARVVEKGKHGFVDKTGKAVIAPRFDLAWEFSLGLARVVLNGREGYIDKSGVAVWPPRQ